MRGATGVSEVVRQSGRGRQHHGATGSHRPLPERAKTALAGSARTAEAGDAPSSVSQPGRIVARRFGGARQNSIGAPVRLRATSTIGEAASVIRSASCGPGSRAVVGGRARLSVGRSRVGASFSHRRGEPRGEPRRCAIARRGSSIPFDEVGWVRRATRVRGDRQERKRESPWPHSTARSRTKSTEGVLDSCVRHL